MVVLPPGWGAVLNISSGVIAALQRHGAEVVMVQPDTVTADPALWPFWAADVSVCAVFELDGIIKK